MHGDAVEVVLATVAAVTVIVFLSQVLGWAARRLGQPTVLGEMLVGILLGPSILGELAPQVSATVFPDEIDAQLLGLATIGLTLYMFLVGAEHGFGSLGRKETHTVVVLSLLGIVLPVLVGGTVTWLVAEQWRPAGINPLLYCLFVGLAMAVTALPVLARILQDRLGGNTRLGALAVLVAAADDAIGWCGLAILIATASSGSPLAAGGALFSVAALVVLAVWLVPRLFRGPLTSAARAGKVSDSLIAALLVTVLTATWLTEAVGIGAAFGGFLIGWVLPKVPGAAALLQARMLQPVRVLLLPIFFAYSGLKVELTSLGSGIGVLALVAMVVAAVVSKGLAAVLVLRIYGRSWNEGVAMAGLLNARGLMLLVFANAALVAGIIEATMFSILVLVAIITTAMAVPLYRLGAKQALGPGGRATPCTAEAPLPARSDPDSSGSKG